MRVTLTNFPMVVYIDTINLNEDERRTEYAKTAA